MFKQFQEILDRITEDCNMQYFNIAKQVGEN
jgi:hypothetical protein